MKNRTHCAPQTVLFTAVSLPGSKSQRREDGAIARGRGLAGNP